MMKFLLTLLATFYLGSTLANANTISVVPSSNSVVVGDEFYVNVMIADLGAGTLPSVGTFDFDLTFDPAFVTFGSASYGTALDVLGLGSLNSTTPSFGKVNLFELSLDLPGDLNSLQPDTFLLSQIKFRASSIGTSALTISVNALGDADGIALPFSKNNSTVTIMSAVPEPETYAMLMMGIGMMTFVIRSRKQARSA